MGLDPPPTYWKLGPVPTSTATIPSTWGFAIVESTPGVVYVSRSARARAFERARRWESDVRKLHAFLHSLATWRQLATEARRRLSLVQEDAPARPPKTRTEWGMVHRERCVHRTGIN